MSDITALELQSMVEPATADILRIFISYRADPDAPLANAMKRLVESSIIPQPEVFVAGDGGLRPSNIGFKNQLQQAAQRSHAFVAIITNASKEREWIFFEAGAAWGRDLMYCPVLVGQTPGDLPSTIGDYQALKSQSRDDMQRLINSLAGLVAAEVKDRFGPRFQVFERTVKEYLQVDGEQDSTVKEDFDLAFTLGIQGEYEESNRLFDKLEAAESNVEERCMLRIYRFRSQNKPQEMRRLLRQVDSSLSETSTCYYHLALETQRPRKKKEYLQKAIDLGYGRFASAARLELARLSFQIGEVDQAVEALLKIVGEDSKNPHTEAASEKLVELPIGISRYEQLVLHFAGLTGVLTKGYQVICDLARKHGWISLELFCAKKIDELEDTGNSANNLGIARQNAELHALAYEAYENACRLGVSVSRCNMAGLILYRGNAFAAIKVISEHEGRFDAADPDVPYQLRAEAEKTLSAERDREDEIMTAAARQFNALWEFSERAIFVGKYRDHLRGTLVSPSLSLKVDGNEISVVNRLTVKMESSKLFGMRIVAISAGDELAVVSMSDTVEGIYFSNISKSEGLEWFVWTPESDTSKPSEIAHADEQWDAESISK